jgi:hypothetical protein
LIPSHSMIATFPKRAGKEMAETLTWWRGNSKPVKQIRTNRTLGAGAEAPGSGQRVVLSRREGFAKTSFRSPRLVRAPQRSFLSVVVKSRCRLIDSDLRQLGDEVSCPAIHVVFLDHPPHALHSSPAFGGVHLERDSD